MEFGLADKVVIVTGATANIGRAIALDFAVEGAKVIIVGRDVQAGANVVELARARGARGAVFVQADLLDPESPGRILREAETLGPVQVLVNNVGGNAGLGLFAQSDPASWQAHFDLSLMTMLRMTRVVLPGMIERRAGRIINIGSTAGLVGDYIMALYSAAKAAVHGFTRALAKEVGEHNITVNCVAPYGTMSDDPAAFSSGSRFHPEHGHMLKASRHFSAEINARRRRVGPLPRQIGRPEEVSAAVLWLASVRADFVTGQIIPIDGGTLL
jgi:NAD(P)-dependent dehydrogenase (short-subunit alcohol dehydrogenase family)